MKQEVVGQQCQNVLSKIIHWQQKIKIEVDFYFVLLVEKCQKVLIFQMKWLDWSLLLVSHLPIPMILSCVKK